ncbi:MAG: hypothetical protein QOH83_2757 [Solirubrobacteraceae bacterium]|nr:hypothetical protein [Solirubrobacteraceae bacterium]
MGARSRKRKRSGTAPVAAPPEQQAPPKQQAAGEPAPPAAPPKPQAASEPAPPAAPAEQQAAGEPAPPDDGLRRGYARGRARDEEIRANLPPLAPGERPRAVTVAAIVAFVFAIGNAAAALTGNDISSASGDPSFATAVTTALLLVAGFGMLARQYWAVLGFQTILGLQIVFFSLYLIGVQKWWHAIIPLVAIGLLGWLFWKLVRPMAQLQMPKRSPGEPAP